MSWTLRVVATAVGLALITGPAEAGLLLDLVEKARASFPGGEDLEGAPLFRGQVADCGRLEGSTPVSVNDEFGPRLHTVTYTKSMESELIDRFALTGAYPVVSSSPSLVYEMEPETGMREFVESSLGPIYSERSNTIGNKKLSLGTAITYFRYAWLDGSSFDELNQVARPGNLEDQILSRFDVRLDYWVVNLIATYGLAPTWDLSLLVPLVTVQAAVRREAEIRDATPWPIRHSFDPERVVTEISGSTESATRFGVGDVILRTKKELKRTEHVGLAASLGLTFPTGDARNLLGSDSLVLDLGLFGSASVRDWLYPHINAVFDFKLWDTGAIGDIFDESAGNAKPIAYPAVLGFRWVVGVEAKLHEMLTAILDLRGASDIAARDQLVLPAGCGPPTGGDVVGKIETRDSSFDLAIGLKGRLWTDRAVAYVNLLIPLNPSVGARAEFAPTAGLEVSF